MTCVLATAMLWTAGWFVMAGGPEARGDGEAPESRLFPRVKMETPLGDIILELDGERCPATTMNFIWYGESGFYNGTIFHRVIQDKYIQGGGFLPNLDRKTEGLRPGIPSEWDTDHRNTQWTIAMVRRPGRPDSATSQFYINVNDVAEMDKVQTDRAGYTVFGKVVDGFKTVAKIRDTKTTTSDKYGGTASTIPAEPIVVKSVSVVSEFDRARLEAIASGKINEVNEARDTEDAQVSAAMKEWIKKLEEEAGTKIITTEKGVMYVDLKVGEGVSPTSANVVEIHYTGWTLDGTEIHSSRARGEPFRMRLDEYLRGWIDGMETMKPGGRRKMIIPDRLAFGGSGTPGIVPPRATMVYDMELLAVYPPEVDPGDSGDK